MTGLTPDQKRILHTAPCCGHLIANHDGAGCVACTNDVERDLDPCMESPATIETTYEAVAALVAAERDRLSAAMHADLADRMRAEQIERLAEAFYTGHGWAWGDDEMDPEDRAACVESMSSVAPVVAALIAEAVEEARGEDAKAVRALAYELIQPGRGLGTTFVSGVRAGAFEAGQQFKALGARIARGEVSP